jgi:uncharacterized ferritin-like protein (DUF455 family)
MIRYQHYELPKEFYDDMMFILSQEAAHFQAWEERLNELNLHYGCLPVYEGLWDSAKDTSRK